MDLNAVTDRIGSLAGFPGVVTVLLRRKLLLTREFSLVLSDLLPVRVD